jgi:hypothetical protein
MPKRKAKIHRIPLSEARSTLGVIARRVHKEKSYFVLEDRGQPIAALMDVDELEDFLEVNDPAVQEHIRQSYQEYLEGQARPVEEFLTELEAEIGIESSPRECRTK